MTPMFRVASGLCLGGLLALAAGLGPGCRRPAGTEIAWAELVGRLADFDQAARLDTPPSRLLASTDPAGGNDDYNRFLRPGREPGWVVLADLKGPGVVTRLWFTCSVPDWPLRFYFDGEKAPRLDGTFNSLFGAREPFLPPLADHANICWYSFVPLPYRKRLILEARRPGTDPGNWPRLFFQVNAGPPPGNRPAASFPAILSEADRAAAAAVRRAWAAFQTNAVPPGTRTAATNLTLAPGTVATLFEAAGPAVLRSFWIEPDVAAITSSATAREQVLRDVVLRIRWNGTDDPSVAAPLGDFFGSVWQRARYQSLYFGLTNDRFLCRWPMPFETAAEISLENQGTTPLPLRSGIGFDPLPAWDPAWGYLHAGWQRSGPETIGRPHAMLRAEGRGKYLGCVMSVVSADRSYWMLEGDEAIRTDGETVPGWRGTGLEDYFNAGWYYRNVMTFPLHGVPFKAPFRTVQYSLHLANPIVFKSACEMTFERGPDNASRGWMESLAWYVLEQPAAAYSALGRPEDRRMPPDALAQATLMTEIWNFERLGDLRGASDYMDRYLETYPEFPFADVLRLRQAATRERLGDAAAARAAYERIAAGSTNDLAQQYARLLLWAGQSPSNALVIAFANTRTRVYLDSRLLGEAGNPEHTMVWGVQVAPGRHVLALESQHKPYPSWVQMMLRTHGGDFFTTPAWKHALQPPAGWLDPGYDDRGWTAVGDVTKGPPEEPHVWVVPDPFVDYGKAAGIAPRLDWPPNKLMVYRAVVEVP